jgi:hypothetical protein
VEELFSTPESASAPFCDIDITGKFSAKRLLTLGDPVHDLWKAL